MKVDKGKKSCCCRDTKRHDIKRSSMLYCKYSKPWWGGCFPCPVCPTRPNVTANNASITNPGEVFIGDGEAIPFTNNMINGTAISHVPGSPQIILAANQTYYAIVETAVNTDAPGSAQIELRLDGVPIIGSQAQVADQPAMSTANLVTASIFTTGLAPAVLTVNNISAFNRLFTGSNVNIIKLQ